MNNTTTVMHVKILMFSKHFGEIISITEFILYVIVQMNQKLVVVMCVILWVSVCVCACLRLRLVECLIKFYY